MNGEIIRLSRVFDKGLNMTLDETISVVLGIKCGLHDGRPRINGRILRKVSDSMKAFIPPIDARTGEVEDTEFDAQLLTKVQDIEDGATNALTVDEQAALAEAEATEAFTYRDLFDEMWEMGLIQELMMRYAKQTYSNNPAWAANWRAKVQAAGIPAKFAAING